MQITRVRAGGFMYAAMMAPFFHELRVVLLGFMEPTLLALPFEPFFLHPCPDGGVREVDTMALLESTLESFQRPEFIWHSPQGNPAVPLASYMRLCNCHVNDPVIYWE